jgi:EAL domain-containing protein (putative c-di-GMP-specific phosphodiesterase class I)
MSADSVSLARAQLLRAVETGAIRLAFQPQIDLHTQKIVSFEGVARWHHDELGVLTPGLFLGLAAREGLLSVISRTLMADAARAVASWRARGFGVQVSVNLSVSDITDPDFGHDIAAIVAGFGALPHWIVLEASEEGLAFAGERGYAGLESLARLGFKIALDAKGPPIVALDKRGRALFCQLKCGGTTMLSVASQLHSMGASSFMRRLDAARNAGLPVVAVGAEVKDSLDLYKNLGFTRLQGKIISMPVSIEECTRFLEQVGVHTNLAEPIEAIDVAAFAPPEAETETEAVSLVQEAQSLVQPVAAPIPIVRGKGITIFSLDFDDEDRAKAA